MRSSRSSPRGQRSAQTGPAAASAEACSKAWRVIAASSSARWNPCSVTAPTGRAEPQALHRRLVVVPERQHTDPGDRRRTVGHAQPSNPTTPRDAVVGGRPAN